MSSLRSSDLGGDSSDAGNGSCLLRLFNTYSGRSLDAQLTDGQSVPDGVAEALATDHRNLAHYEVRTLLDSRGRIGLSSFDTVKAPSSPSFPVDTASAGYVELVYMEGLNGPEWVVLEAITTVPCE
jgi:hypothetical protein